MGFCCCCCFCTFSAKLPFRFHFESIWISFWNIDQKLWFTLRFIFIIMAKQWAVKLSFVPFYFYAVFWILAFSRNISFNKTFIGYILHCCVDKEIIYIPKLRCSIDIECECAQNDQCIYKTHENIPKLVARYYLKRRKLYEEPNKFAISAVFRSETLHLWTNMILMRAKKCSKTLNNYMPCLTLYSLRTFIQLF